MLMAIIAFFGVIITGKLARILPDGILVEKSRIHVGMIYVPADGSRHASWTSARMLRDNANALPSEGIKVEHICVDVPQEIFETLARSPTDQIGGKSVLVSVIAEKRLGDWPCLQKLRRRQAVMIGDKLVIKRVISVRMLGCDTITFLANRLRCPKSR